MAKATLSATLPDGTKATRKTHVKYTHVVAVRPSLIYALDRAKASITWPNFKGNYLYNVQTIELGAGSLRRSGSMSWTISQDDVERAQKAIGSAKSFEEYSQRILDEDLAAIEMRKAEGYFTKWIDIRWSTRLDLASQAANAALAGGMWLESRVVPVDA